MQAVEPGPWQPTFLFISGPFSHAKRLQRQLTLQDSHEDSRHGPVDIFGLRFFTPPGLVTSFCKVFIVSMHKPIRPLFFL